MGHGKLVGNFNYLWKRKLLLLNWQLKLINFGRKFDRAFIFGGGLWKILNEIKSRVKEIEKSFFKSNFFVISFLSFLHKRLIQKELSKLIIFAFLDHTRKIYIKKGLFSHFRFSIPQNTIAQKREVKKEKLTHFFPTAHSVVNYTNRLVMTDLHLIKIQFCLVSGFLWR